MVLCYLKIKKKLRVFITNQFYPGKSDADNEEDSVPQWELKIEGRLLDDVRERLFIYFSYKLTNNTLKIE